MSDPVTLWGQPAEVWTALAACATALIAAGAAVVAYFQVREARRLREEQAQPFVIADIAPSPAVSEVFELVIRNIGSTLAQDVRVDCDPPLENSMGTAFGDWFVLRQGIPSLPPGAEFRALFDVSYDRTGKDLPDRFTFTVNATDARKRPLKSLSYVTDLSIWFGGTPQYLGVRTIHDAAKTLESMASIMDRWTYGGSSGKGLRVARYEGTALDVEGRERAHRAAEHFRERRASREAEARTQAMPKLDAQEPDPSQLDE